MDFKDMVYLDAIDRHRKLTDAAKELYITQPALTRFLKSFQYSVGAELFRWVGNHMVPTPVGEQYLLFARHVLAEKKQLDATISLMNGGNGVLRIGIPISQTVTFADAILRFEEIYPNVELVIIENYFPDIEKALMDCQLDIAFVSNYQENTNVIVDKICDEELCLYIPPTIPVKQSEHVDFSDYPWVNLYDYQACRFLIPQDSQTTGLYTRKIFAEYDFQPQKLFTIRNLAAEMRLAQSGYGICFYFVPPVPTEWSLPKEEEQHLYSFGTHRHHSSLYALYSKKLHETFHVREFIELIKDTFQ